MDWTIIKPPSYTVESIEEEDLKSHPEYLRNLQTINKKPHELRSEDLVNWRSVENNRAAYIRINKKSPFCTIWDYIDPPVGTWIWDRGVGNLDVALGKLELVEMSSIIPLNCGRAQWNPRERFKIESYRIIYRDKPVSAPGDPQSTHSNYVDPIRVYEDNSNKYVILDGYKRFMAAKKEGVLKIKAWVFKTENNHTLNRTLYIKEAKDEGQEVVDSEYTLDNLGPSSPIYAPTLSYRELRKLEYPPIGDQLDAVFKFFVENKSEELELISQKILEVKNKFKKE